MNKKPAIRHAAGFSLVELLVILAVISIMFAIIYFWTHRQEKPVAQSAPVPEIKAEAEPTKAPPAAAYRVPPLTESEIVLLRKLIAPKQAPKPEAK